MNQDIRAALELLRVAKCPNAGCSDGVIAHGSNAEGWEPEQCQWCDERAALLASQEAAPQSQDAERYRIIRTALHPEDVRHILDEMRFFGEWAALEVDAVIDAALQAKEQR